MTSRSMEQAEATDLTACDREPIHIPGSIQPHGLLLVAEAATGRVVAGAGALEAEIAPDWLGRTLTDLLGQDIDALVADTAVGPGGTLIAEPLRAASGMFDVALHRAGPHLLAELEPAPAEAMKAGPVLNWLDAIAATFERATDVVTLCERAAAAFRALTGFDRVMVYRFIDDDAGRVVAEDRDPALGTFLHHHFPATDIPQQARALYIRNRARAIPVVDYQPAPLRPATFSGLDLSDVAVRSVSPIHLQYLRNMGVAASASISIVKDGVLWGLIACHHNSPHHLPRDVRTAAVTLASGLARQIRAKEEAEAYRERLRLRAAEDAVVPWLASDRPLRQTVASVAGDLRAMLGSDGFAFVQGGKVELHGVCPSADEVLSLARWVRTRGREPIATHCLSTLWPDAEAFTTTASGMLAVQLDQGGGVLLWFRVEHIEEVEWAGNPHKAVQLGAGETLTPRASFESWTQEVRSRSRRWSLEEVEAAHRLRRAFGDAQAARQMRTLNAELEEAVAEKDVLIAQKDVLMKDVDHRVQNSIQLISAFLALQARDVGDPVVAGHLREAQSRLSAVALVHRRLYSDGQVATVDLSRYLEELAGDMKQSLGSEWAQGMRVSLAPVLVPTDRAVSIGLIMTELVINATKYAYRGAPGPIDIALEQHRNQLRLIVADGGGGKLADSGGTGFGSRMLASVVDRLSGTIDYTDNQPGLRAILTAPIEERPR
jgi:light-regulated signal transduction histidine kinase (bacteriophytochrome)